VGIIGVSVAIALFPTMSRDAALGRIGEIRRQVAGAVRVLIFVAAPLMAVMIVLREPLTSIFYQYGLFSQDATERTASALAWFAVGLIGHIVVHVLARAFYAMQDTRTPVMWAIIAVAINIPLMVLLVDPMGIEGLALALSISAVIEVIGLLWSLRTRLEGIEGRSILGSLLRAGVAAFVAAALMASGLALIDTFAPSLLQEPFSRLVAFLVLSGIGAIGFVLVGLVLRSPELLQLRDAVLRRRAA
jgi:putative peptidoglycan lipid II flippase